MLCASNLRLQPMNRWKAATLHALASLLLVAAITAIVVPLWHPWGLYRISGVLPLLGLLLGAQMIAGPVLTFIVFKPGKKSLRLDLAVVCLLQLAFLGFGLHMLWQTRPVFVVASDMRLALILANEVEAADLARASHAEWSRLPKGAPLLVGLRPGTARTDHASVLAAFLDTGMDQERNPAWYVPYAQVVPRLAFNAAPSTADGQPASTPEEAPFRSLPIVARHGAGRMVLDAGSLQPIRVATY
ncbi:MAG: hypothetical protein J0I01_10105 [Stenotrophomonas nitritireducens]|uniref:Uncharacterized protein n=1 Tax=Stenotrophomonas nitritireducens TaxID=83617 RepID=A0A9D8Q1U3_9GAMM|nr:hypothetical protein [Stenotrophomonas nitritireducens]MBN8792566.1 hypothetical protein [Stenotrophomonas nitritireducens]MBN8796960.1 hypothetical protein [Stenotrophomonas nitritireducens]MBN8800006.1 hypothetical protein [Stenotrophomonas nitritireducens]